MSYLEETSKFVIASNLKFEIIDYSPRASELIENTEPDLILNPTNTLEMLSKPNDFYSRKRVVINSISVNDGVTLALDSEGYVWAWCGNDYEKLASDNYNKNAYIPTKLKLSNIIAVETARSYSLALEKDGTVWQWNYTHSQRVFNNPIVVN